MLTGTVNVVFNAGTGLLTFEGDADPNSVRIEPGANPGEVRIIGEDNTSINGPTLIVDPIDRIEVELNGGSDTFVIEGQDANTQLAITAEVEIINEDGANVNRFVNAFLYDTLTLLKNASVSESTLEIEDTEIVGLVTVDNANGGEGATKTRIVGSHLQNDLFIDNGAGFDILVVYDTSIDGDAVVTNGDGGSRTTFGIEEDPIVWGDLFITNLDGNDKVTLHDTSVWGQTFIDNGDGHTMIDIENTHLGLGRPVIENNTLQIDNGAGYDQLRISGSTFRDHVDVDNGTGTYGGTVDIIDSELGNDFIFSGDDGREIINVLGSRVVDDFLLTLFNGSSEVTLKKETTQGDATEIGEELNIAANGGSDVVRITEATVIRGDVDIDLGDGVDLLELLAASQLRGSSSLEGGNAIDTYHRDSDVTVAFEALETFEIGP